MDIKTPRHEKGSFAEAADHLISAFDCYKLEGDKKAAVKHVLMAFESKEAPALFRFLQERDDKGWDEATASFYALAELDALDGFDPNDEDEFGFVEDAPIGDSKVFDTDDFLNDDDTAPVYSHEPVHATLEDILGEPSFEGDELEDLGFDLGDEDDFDADFPEEDYGDFGAEPEFYLPELDDTEDDIEDLIRELGDEPEAEDDFGGFLALPAPRD